jgi:long-chain acyl-CoA synthetase
MEDVTRLFDLLPRYAEKFNKSDALAAKENGSWTRYSIHEFINIVRDISYGLLNLGIEKGDRIATISSNSPEWNFVDMAILQVGCIHVPLYPTISESDYRYILSHAEVRIIFVSGWDIYRKIQHIMPDFPGVKAVFAFKEIEGIKHLSELISLGSSNPLPEKLESIKNSIHGDDMATIIYTSGTTGNPKGVMLSHKNIISNLMECQPIMPFGSEGWALSYLPLCHIYERMLGYLYFYRGVSIYYTESIATIVDNLKEIQPYILSTVPRLLEKMYEKIMANGHRLKGIKKFIFFWAIRVANRYEMYGANGFYYAWKLKLAQKLVLDKIRSVLGNNMKVVVSGGAAIQPRLVRFFWAIGIPLLEGYGLTETSPVIAAGNFEKGGIKFGTIGHVLSNTTVKIADDGEILCKGPGVMLGYYQEPSLTAEAIDPEGWFHTGDLGRIESQGHLKITGRKKELFKTSFGKYISPELIENKFKESHFIDTITIVGENKKYAGALIVPDFNFLKSWCAEKQITYTTDSEMVANDRIKKRFAKEVLKFNKFFGTTEQVKVFEILDKEWSVESGEVTATLKIRRHFVQEKYAAVIEKMFNRKCKN